MRFKSLLVGLVSSALVSGCRSKNEASETTDVAESVESQGLDVNPTGAEIDTDRTSNVYNHRGSLYKARGGQ